MDAATSKIDSDLTPSPLARAIAAAGTQVEFAAICKVTQSTVSKWLAKGELPGKYALVVERKTGVPKEQLCPDIYPPDLATTAAPTPDRLEGVRQ
ncbi:transcriptional regulator [Sphingomonas sp.]|uniref:transcriptional regulator n=1 Tax=Sphingomonas sp. TaxID=28214 RepID=UPI003F706391